jgi:biopolymer transport protein ExbD
MKIRKMGGGLAEKIDINMTPMIDIVFQLMAFFIMTLKIVSLEGDFDIKMPRGASAGPSPLVAIPLRLTAGADGGLSGIHLGDRALADFDELRVSVRDLLGDGSPAASPPSTELAAEFEVEIDADPTLHYEHTMRAITTVSGYVGPDRRIVPLARKIRFAPAR